jgi:hypothetical protein
MAALLARHLLMARLPAHPSQAHLARDLEDLGLEARVVVWVAGHAVNFVAAHLWEDLLAEAQVVEVR